MLQAMPSVGIYTLGCKVNQYESEAIAEALTAHGFSLRPHEQKCDIYIINTCTVTAESDRKAGQFIRRAIAQNPNAYIIVTGCLSQTDPPLCAMRRTVNSAKHRKSPFPPLTKLPLKACKYSTLTVPVPM